MGLDLRLSFQVCEMQVFAGLEADVHPGRLGMMLPV